MSIARIPIIRAKVARQSQLVRHLAAELSAETAPRYRAEPRQRLARTLSAPAALLLSVFHLTPAAAKTPEPAPVNHDLPRGESVVVYYEH